MNYMCGYDRVGMYLGRRVLLAVVLAAGLLVSCGPKDDEQQRHHDANTPAGKAGQAAYGASKQIGKAAKAAGKELSKAAHEAHEGWKEAEAKDKKK